MGIFGKKKDKKNGGNRSERSGDDRERRTRADLASEAEFVCPDCRMKKKVVNAMFCSCGVVCCSCYWENEHDEHNRRNVGEVKGVGYG